MNPQHQHFLNVTLSVLIAGFVYWALTFAPYLVLGFVRGYAVYDALLMIVPVMAFVFAVSCFVAFPTFLILERHKLDSFSNLLSISIFFSVLVLNFFTDNWSNCLKGYLIPMLSAFAFTSSLSLFKSQGSKRSDSEISPQKKT